MRKKSHMSLSRYLLESIDSSLLDEHKKAFVLGSILPDCRPSFVTRRHNIEETFDIVSGFIDDLTVASSDYRRISTAYCRKLGEVTHYVADYFTYPHNDIFDGGFKAHCIYEKELKYSLKEYIQSEDVIINREVAEGFETPQDLCDYVKQRHIQYLNRENNVESDCRYIVASCHVVVAGILNLLNMNRNLAA